MKVTLIGKTVSLIDNSIPEVAASICYDSHNPASALKGALSSGHESVMEHQSYSFLIEEVSRTLLAQLTRHRLASFSVQSQRYCGVENQDVIIPDTIADDETLAKEYADIVKRSRRYYDHLVNVCGIPAEDARYITPQGITTKLVMTANARELNHFLRLRMCNRAQWEIRELADAMRRILYKENPSLFANALPGCCTKQGCTEGRRSCGRKRTDLLEATDDR